MAFIEGDWQTPEGVQHIKVWDEIGGVHIGKRDMARLFKGETVRLNGVTYTSGPGKHNDVPVRLGYYVSQTGEERVGVRFAFGDRITGNWQGSDVSLRKEVCGHVITDGEAVRLFKGEKVVVHDLQGHDGPHDGALYIGDYNGRPSIEIDHDRGPGWEGSHQGSPMTIQKDFQGHHITKQEADAMFAGGKVAARDLVSKKTGRHYGAWLYIGDYKGHPSLRMEFDPYVVPDIFNGHRFNADEYAILDNRDADGASRAITVDDLVSAKSGNTYSATLWVGLDPKGSRKGISLQMSFSS